MCLYIHVHYALYHLYIHIPKYMHAYIDKFMHSHPSMLMNGASTCLLRRCVEVFSGPAATSSAQPRVAISTPRAPCHMQPRASAALHTWPRPVAPHGPYP